MRINEMIEALSRVPARASDHSFMDILSLKVIERSKLPASIVFCNDFLAGGGGSTYSVLMSGIQIRTQVQRDE